MKQKELLLTAFLCLAMGAGATIPARVASTAKALNRAPATEVSFKVNGKPCSMTLGAGGMFVIDMGDAKVCYDGTTQWSYSATDREVTVFNPTADELAQGNPAAILSTLATDFNGVRASNGVFRLTPAREGTDVAEVSVCYPDAGLWPQTMTIVTASGSLTASDMKFKTLQTKKPRSAFQFKIPKGTTITKL